MAHPRKLILRNFQSPGDILMLTAAVRDLHACYPGRFVTDVRTSCPDLWLHNPYLTPLREDDPDVEAVDCHYPLIDRINTVPYHFIHGFIEFLNDARPAHQAHAVQADLHPRQRSASGSEVETKGRAPLLCSPREGVRLRSSGGRQCATSG
jgi:hypothetical protein